MRLAGARVAVSAEQTEVADLAIRGGRIGFNTTDGDASLDLHGYLLLPGLINAHDHLEFSLFPKLGRGIYRNASDWARDVYRPDDSPVREHRAVPKAVRLAWGGIRNLLCGVTTVCHHNPWDASVFNTEFPVRVVQDFDWAHSLAFEPALEQRFRERRPGRPFIIHAAEGTDDEARAEIEALDSLGVLTAETVLVHCFGLAPGDLDRIRRNGCSIVWCPNSNLNTYGATLDADTLASGVPIALGSDSAITAEGDLLDDIQIARCYEMVTTRAAAALGLSDGQGFIREGGVADVVAVRDHGQSPSDAILGLEPEMVMVAGRVRLISEDLAHGFANGLQRIELESRGRWLIDADVRGLFRAAAEHIGPDVRLAGRCVRV